MFTQNMDAGTCAHRYNNYSAFLYTLLIQRILFIKIKMTIYYWIKCTGIKEFLTFKIIRKSD